jgi:Antibiotic biosynthesis monooxygenase
MEKVVVVFEFPGGTAQQFDATWAEMRKQGYDHPKGLLHHVGAPTDKGWLVVDTWESEAAFNEFSKVLMPIVAKAGFPQAKPRIMPIHLEFNPAAEYAEHH